MEAEYLFDATLLQDLKNQSTTLPKTLTVRPLSRQDYEIGYDTVLFPLAAGQTAITHATFLSKFELMRSQVPKTYYTIVLVDSSSSSSDDDDGSRLGGSRVVASATLLVEHKFLRGGSIAGHIEDVVVSPSHQGQKLGRVMIDVLTALAHRLGCYKVILDCSPENVGFYEKCGYESKGVEMKRYL